MPEKKKDISRRDLLRNGARGFGLLALGGAGGFLTQRHTTGDTVWQIDPYKCVQCGKCATECVLEVSAVKCVHAFAICGYCEICTGFTEPDAENEAGGAENELCPTGAITRRFVENPYYEYTIDEELCIGCGKCVAGCNAFGNGSLFLQIRHDRCVNCNQCRIAVACPSHAIRRVPSDQPYILKDSGPSE
jgi:electron transport complex protein RnfB